VMKRTGATAEAPYLFLKPDKIGDMPNILKEISGISLTDAHTFYCIQDESGIVFKYDLQKEELSKIFRFTDIGDFEDLAVVGDRIYILRSDGTLFHFNYRKFDGKVDQTVVPVNSMNVEGLCFDKTDGKLYIASKEQPMNEDKNHREIYEFTRKSMNILSANNRLIAVYKNKQLQKVYRRRTNFLFCPKVKMECNGAVIEIYDIPNKRSYIKKRLKRKKGTLLRIFWCWCMLAPNPLYIPSIIPDPAII